VCSSISDHSRRTWARCLRRERKPTTQLNALATAADEARRIAANVAKLTELGGEAVCDFSRIATAKLSGAVLILALNVVRPLQEETH
jgi:hypothetical protein